MGLIDDAREGLARFTDGAALALRGDPDVTREQMQKAMVQSGLAQPTEETPRGLFHDPYSVQDWGGWRERPSVLTYETLRQMSVKNTVVAAVIQTRVNQVAAFCRPQQGKYDRGYKVILRDRRDTKRQMSPEEERQAVEIERMIETTGFLMPDERASDRDSFVAFIKKSVRDILIYDQWVWEKIRDRRGLISRFICLPSHTIRPAVNDFEHMSPEERRSRVSHVQVYEDTVIAEYSPDDIAWCIMNPRSDIRVNSFGFSPVEQLSNVITSWLFGFEYNTRFFTQGSAIKGLINIKGAIPDRQLKSFRRMWYSMVGGGVQNAWKTPILNAEDLQWVSMHSTNREMEYGDWMDFLTKITTGIFSMSPEEINFQYGNTGQTSTLSQPDNEKTIIESKDKGLRPLMEFIQDSLNQHLIWEINPDFEFAFTGLDAKSEDKEREANTVEVKHFRTVDEIRALSDLDPLPDKKGEVILDPTWLQNAQSQEGGEGVEGGGPLDDIGGDDDEDDDGDDGDDGSDASMSDTGEDHEEGEAEVPGEEPGDGEEDLGKAFQLFAESADHLKKATVHHSVKGDVQTYKIDLGDEP
jgi:phage portal protein BeeE